MVRQSSQHFKYFLPNFSCIINNTRNLAFNKFTPPTRQSDHAMMTDGPVYQKVFRITLGNLSPFIRFYDARDVWHFVFNFPGANISRSIIDVAELDYGKCN